MPSSRNKGLRSVNGCTECRRRKIKCDEAKPVCGRCSRRQAPCTYQKNLRWIQVDNHQAAQDQSRNGNTAPESPPQNDEVDEDSLVNIAPNRGVEIFDGLYELTPSIAPLLDGSIYSQLPADFDAFLTGFYFDQVAPIFCCFGRRNNPFHRLIEKAWNSELRYSGYAAALWAAQSISAAFLSAEIPFLDTVASTLRQQARDHLELSSIVQGHNCMSILTLVLLSNSAFYSQDSAECISIMMQIQDILNPCPQQQSIMPTAGAQLLERERRFFWGLQLFTETFYTFVDDRYCLPAISIPEEFRRVEEIIDGRPHPFTGVSGPTTLKLLEVGHLVRQQRKLATSRAFLSRRHIEQLNDLLTQAEVLEGALIAMQPPTAEQFGEVEDETTTIEHLLKMAESYRESSLLLLYRCFPDLLCRRLGLNDGFSNSNDTEEFLLALTLRIFERVASIPVESRTTPFQTILLLSIFGELKLSGSPRDLEVLHTREMIILRLSDSQRDRPGQRLYKLLRRVRAVWNKLDNAKPGEVVYWLDEVI